MLKFEFILILLCFVEGVWIFYMPVEVMHFDCVSEYCFKRCILILVTYNEISI